MFIQAFPLVLVVSILGTCAVGSAQSSAIGGAPLFGSATVGPTTSRLHGTAGGTVELSGVDGSCVGWASLRPSHTLETAGGPVRLIVDALADTTMMVRFPDGRIVCDDDSGGGNNPLVETTSPAGSIEVWVGSFRGRITFPYDLLASNGAAPPPPPVLHLATSGAPLFGGATLTRTQVALAGTASGAVDLGTVDSECHGFAEARPNHVLTTDGGTVRITTDANGDATMLIRLPDGRVVCDDDSGDGHNPLIEVASTAGRIEVWVGVFGAGSDFQYTLHASRTD